MGILSRRAAGCLVPWLMTAAWLAAASDPPPPGGHSEEEIKSAILYNFTKFVEWPAGALKGDAAPLVIGVLGGDPMFPVLAAVLRNKTVYGHPVVVRRLKADSEAKDFQVLFVGASDSRQIARVLQAVGRSPTLTIGEHDQFSKLGGIIALLRDGNRIRFEVNLDAAERAGLRISSKLLRLASVFREGVPRAGN